MEEPRFFSADSHVNEPPEAWERIPKKKRPKKWTLTMKRREYNESQLTKTFKSFTSFLYNL